MAGAQLVSLMLDWHDTVAFNDIVACKEVIDWNNLPLQLILLINRININPSCLAKIAVSNSKFWNLKAWESAHSFIEGLACVTSSLGSQFPARSMYTAGGPADLDLDQPFMQLRPLWYKDLILISISSPLETIALTQALFVTSKAASRENHTFVVLLCS